MATIFRLLCHDWNRFWLIVDSRKIIWIQFLEDWVLDELLNILVYNIATYARANIEKTANSQIRLDAHSD